MRVTTFFLSAVTGTTALAFALFSGCGDDTTSDGGGGDGGGGSGEDLSDVIYEAEATDEALEALVAAAPKDQPEKAATFLNPANDSELPRNPPFQFEWQPGSGQTGRLESPPSWVTRPVVGRALPRGFAVPASTPPSAIERFGMNVLGHALSNVPSAFAHGTPVNGPGFFLTLSTADNPKFLRVFTLDTKYTPEAPAWEALAAVGEPITARILSAEFEENRVLQDGGPWLSEPITFTIAAE